MDSPEATRAEPSSPIRAHMAAVQLLGHGGYDQLRYAEDVPVPSPGPGEVLIRVAAAGVNNTDINTRIGWYGGGAWTGSGIAFPRIQGADVCGRIVAVGRDVSASRVGERVVVQGCLRSLDDGTIAPWLGSERDGAFAEYVAAPALDTYAVDSDLDDAELAAIPCGFGTAENLVSRARVAVGETVVVTGASGNVGLAAVQLAHRRGARVIAVVAADKAEAIREVGADETVGRDDVASIGAESVDAVIDLVGGPRWPEVIGLLRRFGRYAVAGAIAGPIVELDLRTLYLRDLTLFGCTTHGAEVFPALLSYLARGEIRPVVSARFPLAEIVAAQEAFLSKLHVGKIVLLPPDAS